MRKLLLLLCLFTFIISFSSSTLVDDTTNYYKLDTLSGDVIDSVISSNGTNFGAQRGITGKINDAFRFDDDYVQMNSDITGDTTISASLWFNTISSSGLQSILDLNNDGGSTTKGFSIEFDGDDGVIQPLIDGIARGTGTTIINDGQWHFAVITRNADTFTVYLDGNSTPQASVTNSGGSYGGVNRIARSGHISLSGFFDGDVDEVAIFDKVLTTDEMSTLYNNGTGLTYPFSFDDVFVTLDSPVNSSIESLNVSLNSTIAPSLGFNLTNATLNIWHDNGSLFTTQLVSLSSNESEQANFIVTNLQTGNFVWNVFGQAFNGTSHSGNFSTSNRTFTWVPFDVDNTTFNSSSFETRNEMFTLKITTEPEILSVDAVLNYNGTEYVSDISCALGVCNITNTIDIPLVTSGEDENKILFWEVTVFDGTISFSSNTTSQLQNVSRIHLEECNATFTTETLEFIAFDESDLSSIDPFLFEGDFQIWLGDGSVTRGSNFSKSSVSSVNLCIEPTNFNLFIDGTIEYDEATGSNYTRRNYYFNNDIINSISQGIGLGLLLSELSTSFILAVQDTDILPVADVLILIERFYPGLNEFQTVQIAKTDDNGQSVGFFETEIVDYRFILKQNGTTVLTTGIQKIIGTSVPFTLTFTIGEDAGSAWEDFEELDDLSFSNDFDTQTEIYTFTYADTSGDFTSSLLEVYKINAGGEDNLICSSTSTESSASISCNISGSTNGQYIAKGIILRDGVRNLIFQEQFNINNFAEEAGDLGLFMGWFIILICSFAFRFNEIAGLFMVNAAVIFINAFGLIAFGPVFIGAMITISIIIGVILER